MTDDFAPVLLLLGEIKGELVHIRKLSERVSALEVSQAWLKGGWAVLAGAWTYLWHAKTLT